MAEKEYIEREALIEEAKHNKAVCQAIADIVDVKDIINNTPVADVAPIRHGHFRRLTFSGDTIICSECKMAYNIFETNGAENFNFCPHCGTKMDKIE